MLSLWNRPFNYHCFTDEETGDREIKSCAWGSLASTDRAGFEHRLAGPWIHAARCAEKSQLHSFSTLVYWIKPDQTPSLVAISNFCPYPSQYRFLSRSFGSPYLSLRIYLQPVTVFQFISSSKTWPLLIPSDSALVQMISKWWDGWMASSTQWTWLCANSGRWWRTGKPGVLLSMGSQRVRRDLVTEQKKFVAASELFFFFGHSPFLLFRMHPLSMPVYLLLI